MSTHSDILVSVSLLFFKIFQYTSIFREHVDSVKSIGDDTFILTALFRRSFSGWCFSLTRFVAPRPVHIHSFWESTIKLVGDYSILVC